jgi:hypothetical protein
MEQENLSKQEVPTPTKEEQPIKYVYVDSKVTPKKESDKLSGWDFYQAMGSPKYIVAPMVY